MVSGKTGCSSWFKSEPIYIRMNGFKLEGGVNCLKRVFANS